MEQMALPNAECPVWCEEYVSQDLGLSLVFSLLSFINKEVGFWNHHSVCVSPSRIWTSRQILTTFGMSLTPLEGTLTSSVLISYSQ